MSTSRLLGEVQKLRTLFSGQNVIQHDCVKTVILWEGGFGEVDAGDGDGGGIGDGREEVGGDRDRLRGILSGNDPWHSGARRGVLRGLRGIPLGDELGEEGRHRCKVLR